MSRLIYKICSKPEWAAACAGGIYRGSADDRRDGFIHFSTAAQLERTLTKHFSGKTDLMLVAVDSAALGDALKWEPAGDGALFPHLYADLATQAAVQVSALAPAPDGRHVLPGDFP